MDSAVSVIFRVVTEMFAVEEILAIRIPVNDKGHWTPMHEIADYAWVDSMALLLSKSLRVKDISGREIKVPEKLLARIRAAKNKDWFF